MAILSVQRVSKRYGARDVLREATFAIEDGDRIALVGVNGAGKSTLMRFLAADDATRERDNGPDEGQITRRRGLTVEYVPQEPVLDPDATVLATLRGAREIPDYEIRGLSAALALPPPTARIGELSMGERRRVALAHALLVDPDLLALDEPTNHLDATTIAWLEERLLARRGALLLVTHDRYFLDRVATRILELDRGTIYTHEGGYREFLVRQAGRWAVEDESRAKQAAFVRREIEWIRRGAPARTTKQKARIDRFEASVDAVDSATPVAGPAILRLPGGHRLGSTILELDHVTKRVGDKLLVKDLRLIWKPGDKIGVVGPNGVGKSTLVRMILGQDAPDAGRIIVGQNTQFGFLDQSRATLNDALTVIEEIAGREPMIDLADGPVHPRTFLRQLLFDDQFADAKVAVLSGGERGRVQLAKLLRAAGNFLILDEPTNDLDVLTLGVLEETLRAFGGCALIVSHDRWFLDKVATGILALEGDGAWGFYEGNCSDYLARRAAGSAPTASSPREGRSATTPPPARAVTAETASPTKTRTLTFTEKHELLAIEQRVEQAEANHAALQQRLDDPATYQDRSIDVAALAAEAAAAKAEVDRLYARWQELAALPEKV